MPPMKENTKRANGHIINALLVGGFDVEESRWVVEHEGKLIEATYWEYPDVEERTVVVKTDAGESIKVSFDDIVDVINW